MSTPDNCCTCHAAPREPRNSRCKECRRAYQNKRTEDELFVQVKDMIRRKSELLAIVYPQTADEIYEGYLALATQQHVARIARLEVIASRILARRDAA